MNNLYVNFNIFRCYCDKCRSDLISSLDLRNLSKEISYKCSNLEEESIKNISYSFKCKKCNHVVHKNIIVLRQKSILIAE